MAVFGVKINLCSSALRFINLTNKRLLVDDMLKNPFKGRIICFGDLCYITITPIYTNLSIIGLVSMIISILVFGPIFNWLFIIGSLIALSGVFWTKQFFFIMFKYGLRKAGYAGEIKLLSTLKTLEGVVKYRTT